MIFNTLKVNDLFSKKIFNLEFPEMGLRLSETLGLMILGDDRDPSLSLGLQKNAEC